MQPKIVLVETSHPGNIGAAARAMKTMGFDQLVLVNPKKFPDGKAQAMATHATDVLDNAIVTDSLQNAVADCVKVIGTSTRLRTKDKITLSAADSIKNLQQQFTDKKTAIVFGRESAGLNNAELQICDEQIYIPTVENYSSLNLAQAVQIICYQWNIGIKTFKPQPKIQTHRQDLASNGETQGMLEHLKSIIATTDFTDNSNPEHLMFHLGDIFSRCQLSKKEVNILRGIYSAIEKKIR